MPNFDPSLFDDLDEIKRRLRVLENAARNPQPPQMASTFAAVFAGTFAPTWEYAPSGATYVDSSGNVQSGYPSITMFVPTISIVTYGGRLEGLATSASYRSTSATLGVKVDAVDGLLQAGLSYNQAATVRDVPQSTSQRLTLTPGTHTFTLGVSWANDVPAAPNLPRLSNAFLIVTPQTIV